MEHQQRCFRSFMLLVLCCRCYYNQPKEKKKKNTKQRKNKTCSISPEDCFVQPHKHTYSHLAAFFFHERCNVRTRRGSFSSSLRMNHHDNLVQAIKDTSVRHIHGLLHITHTHTHTSKEASTAGV